MRAVAPVAIVVLVSVVLSARHGYAFQEQPKPTPPQTPARDGTAPPRTGTAALAGTVTADDGSRPVRRATVTLSGADSSFRRTVTTNEMGGFSFTQLPPGKYTLSATRQGYLDVSFGQRTPGSGRPGTAIQLAAGQRLEDVALRMPRTGILTGTINDEFGDPIMGMQVRAWRYVKRSGERTLVAAGSDTTDDRGVYRIASLLPGEYLVATGIRDASESMMLEVAKLREAATFEGVVWVDKASAAPYSVSAISGGQSSASGYAPVYYPGTLQVSSATSLTLGISEERGGIDVQLQAVPLVKISGSVIGPNGGPAAGVEVRLVESGPPSPAARTYSGPVRPDGTFSISSVPPGQYTLMARTNSRFRVRIADQLETLESKLESKLVDLQLDVDGARTGKVYFPSEGATPEASWGQIDLSVDGRPLENVVLLLQRGLDVSGTFDFDGGTPPQPPELSRVRVQLTPASTSGIDAGAPVPAADYSAGRFTFRGVIPGRYRINVTGLPGSWTLKSANFGGHDALDTMLEVRSGDEINGGILTFTTQSTELSGTLQDQSGMPTADFTIVAFPPDRRFWTPMSRRIQATRPSSDGRFAFRNLLAGDYRLIAVVDPEPGEWYDPAFLEQLLGAAMPLTLADGEKKTQDVRVVR
jgi:protocatechuate 3,4-dioxygenase beta subunit